jgi:hypothetical protein
MTEAHKTGETGTLPQLFKSDGALRWFLSTCQNPAFSGWGVVVPKGKKAEATDLAGARMGRAATDGAASAGENRAGVRVCGASSVPNASQNASQMKVSLAAPLRRDRREGLQAGGPAQMEGTRPALKHGRAGRTGAGASTSANLREIAGSMHACGGTCPNVRTDR